MANVRCNRCATLGLQCRIYYSSPGFNKSICLECQTASVSSCMYPPSIRLTAHQSNTACIHCSVHHRKCVFRYATDAQCTRCSKRNLSCMFKINGMFVFNFFQIIIRLLFHITLFILFLGQGSRTDLRQKKRLCTHFPRAILISSDVLQLCLPSWVHVFYNSNTRNFPPSSQRTQAAAIAYKFANSIRTISFHLQSVSASLRDRKLRERLVSITIPPLFHSIAVSHSKSWMQSTVIVCDGGIDHSLPLSPPSHKVSIFHFALMLCHHFSFFLFTPLSTTFIWTNLQQTMTFKSWNTINAYRDLFVPSLPILPKLGLSMESNGCRSWLLIPRQSALDVLPQAGMSSLFASLEQCLYMHSSFSRGRANTIFGDRNERVLSQRVGVSLSLLQLATSLYHCRPTHLPLLFLTEHYFKQMIAQN